MDLVWTIANVVLLPLGSILRAISAVTEWVPVVGRFIKFLYMLVEFMSLFRALPIVENAPKVVALLTEAYAGPFGRYNHMMDVAEYWEFQ